MACNVFCRCGSGMKLFGYTEKNYEIWICENPACGKAVTVKELTADEARKIKECPRINGHC
jgi:hypothetical protein